MIGVGYTLWFLTVPAMVIVSIFLDPWVRSLCACGVTVAPLLGEGVHGYGHVIDSIDLGVRVVSAPAVAWPRREVLPHHDS